MGKSKLIIITVWSKSFQTRYISNKVMLPRLDIISSMAKLLKCFLKLSNNGLKVQLFYPANNTTIDSNCHGRKKVSFLFNDGYSREHISGILVPPTEMQGTWLSALKDTRQAECL